MPFEMRGVVINNPSPSGSGRCFDLKMVLEIFFYISGVKSMSRSMLLT